MLQHFEVVPLRGLYDQAVRRRRRRGRTYRHRRPRRWSIRTASNRGAVTSGSCSVARMRAISNMVCRRWSDGAVSKPGRPGRLFGAAGRRARRPLLQERHRHGVGSFVLRSAAELIAGSLVLPCFSPVRRRLRAALLDQAFHEIGGLPHRRPQVKCARTRCCAGLAHCLPGGPGARAGRSPASQRRASRRDRPACRCVLLRRSRARHPRQARPRATRTPSLRASDSGSPSMREVSSSRSRPG